MKRLFLVALCSTSLLSIARAEGDGNTGSGNSIQQGDAMNAGDDAGRAGSMAPDSTRGDQETAKKRQARKRGAYPQMKHDGMDHGSMQYDGTDHG